MAHALHEILTQITHLTDTLEKAVTAQHWEEVEALQAQRQKLLDSLSSRLDALSEAEQKAVFDCLTSTRQRDQMMAAQVQKGMNALSSESDVLQKGKRMQKAYGAFK